MDTPPVNNVAKASFLKKKVAGIPVVYLLGAFVAVLVIIAVRTKKPLDVATAGDTGPAAGNPTDPNSASDAGVNAGETYPQLPSGTVVATTTPVDTNPAGNTAITSNDQWVSVGALWYSKEKGISPGTAQAALMKYINGDSLSWDEGVIRDAVVRQYGFPPDSTPIPITGTKPVASTPAAPAQKQGPLPRNHIVKGPNDNTFYKLSMLYYGHADGDKLQAANSNLGSVGTTSVIPVGTSVHIPADTPPKYFTSTKTINTAAAVARVNGITPNQLQALNDSNGRRLPYPLPVGTRVRVG